MVENPDLILLAIEEAGLNQWLRELGEAAKHLGPDEMIWQGWYAEDGILTNLYAVGVLKHKETYYTRLLQVREVPAAQRAGAEEGAGLMIEEYMDALLYELDRTIRPGRGKRGWQSLN